ncbi:MAG: TonB-dependent receptor [Acidobacteria bacterium]|nr:TonB-dependent receptor [Acidobacteriota bacterium]
MRLIYVVFTALLLTIAIANAQVGGSGTIQGTVTDPSGATVVGATVVAINVETGVETSRKSNESGFFVLSPLQPGEYTVTIKAEGFQTLSQQHVVVVALGTIGLNPKLTLGTATQSITVADAPPQLHTDDATLGSSMENSIYAALPLQMNGVPRDPTQFVALVPGVNSASTQAAGPSTAAFNGGQTYQNEVYLEGIPLTSAGTQGDTRYLALAVSVDAVDQFQVETNGAKAQYQGQGVENYVLKSGTNSFHGAAFEYFRNTSLDARGFFPANRPADHQNEYGGLIGGPIKKNKLFFFTNYDGYRYRSGSTPVLQSIPTLAERNGDFSGLPASQVIYDPRSQSCAGAICTRTPFAGNVIPPGQISPIAKSLASYLPDPTNTNVQNNYLSSLPIQVDTYNFTGKVDANLSDRHRLYGFFAGGHYTTNFTGSLNQTGAGVLPEPYTQGRIVEEAVKMGQVHDTYTLTPSLLNQFSASYNRIWIPLSNPTTAGAYPQKAGIKGLPPSVVQLTFPDINFSGTNSPGGWQGTNAHFFNEAANTFSLQDNVMWVKGRHSIAFGFQYQALQDNENFALVASFNFNSVQTQGYNPTGTLLSTTGNSYASYLLGAVNSSGVSQNAIGETGGRYKTYATYIQDDWKVSDRLTLNLGLRWDLFGPFSEVNNLMSFFNPALPNPAVGGRPGALQFAGGGAAGCNCRTPVDTHYKNFGPRFGAAYRLNDKTVLRAGFAIMYVHAGGVGGRNNSRQGLSQLGFNATNSATSPGNNAPAYYWDNGVPPIAQAPPFIDPSYGTGFITSNPTGVQNPVYGDPVTGGKPPYYENWNFGIQRSLTSHLTLGAAYSASMGKFLAGPGNGGGSPINVAPLKYLALGSLLTATANPTNIAAAQAIFPGIGLPFSNFVGTIGQMLRPFPQYSTISSPWFDVGQSNYQALQINVNRRFDKGFTFAGGYTFSKEMDNLLGSARNPFDYLLEKSRGAIDHRHVFTASWAYELPFGKGHRLDPGNAAVRAVAGGWTISGIVSYTTGAPLALTGTACNSGGILGTCIPNYNPTFTGDVRINGNYGDGNVLGSSPTSYLNRAAFVAPAPYTVGNLPRTGVYGLNAPFNSSIDLSLRREFPIREKIKLAIQGDAFNVNNAVRFAAPGTNPDQASFGTVTSQANQPRRLQVNARITF